MIYLYTASQRTFSTSNHSAAKQPEMLVILSQVLSSSPPFPFLFKIPSSSGSWIFPVEYCTSGQACCLDWRKQRECGLTAKLGRLGQKVGCRRTRLGVYIYILTRWTRWTLIVACPRWQHRKHYPGIVVIIIIIIIIIIIVTTITIIIATVYITTNVVGDNGSCRPSSPNAIQVPWLCLLVRLFLSCFLSGKR